MTDPASLISPIDVAVCDADLLWRVERMNVVKGVNVHEFASAGDALECLTPGHPSVVVIGPSSPLEDLAKLAASGPQDPDVRLVVVGRADEEGLASRAAAVGVDLVLPFGTADSDFAAAVLDLLPRPTTHGGLAGGSEPGPDVGPQASPRGADADHRRGVASAGTFPYQHVIVPFDGTDRAQRATNVGAELAHMMGADLVVMTAHDAGDGESLRKVKDRAKAMSHAAATIWIEPQANEAKAVATMLSYRPHSLICMSTTARTGVLRAAYGSMAERLLHSIDAPLLLIGPRWAGASVTDLRHLVVCVDGSPTSEAAIPLAGAWADAMPLNVTMLHVRTGDAEPAVDLDRLAFPLEQRCEIVDKVVVDNPDVVKGILEVVDHSTSPFVVMATHARTGRDRIISGSVMASLIAKCEVPVLVQRGPIPTRPEGLGPARR